MDSLQHGLGHATGLKPDVNTKDAGGSGGKDFYLTNGKHVVTKVKVWTDTGSGDWKDRDLVKDIEVTFDDGMTAHVTGNQTGNSSDLEFGEKEKVASMVFRTGARVDKVYFKTDLDNELSQGTENGSPHDQNVGNGVLLGFHGRWDETNKELIALGSRFQDKNKK
ncbi:uncharacterized protein UV8b_04910 [Ustilaginoidea virens]|uniref:Jacalin-type lectin domain-containing protein n=1 Tax=Ustilaginoidea virens TaxID=1159556 RepID=A0A063BQ25_USTVR|nr:uncharacterized protein UV8b_04910 [Ustilaginoidea virens]QUC20669.1 hypothetical protein UV8b_04910 [Ustilaginoidea virens]GAO15274.1 hypothetical protein UVI_02040990 [Ustilaginoidea virens]